MSLRWALLLGLGLLAGCVGPAYQPTDALLAQAERCLVPVVDGQNQARGVGVVLRATHERVILALGNPPDEERDMFLSFGDERVPAHATRVGGLVLLDASRDMRDLRAVQQAQRPQVGEFVFVFTAPEGVVERGLTSVSISTPEELHLLSAPSGGARGGVVLTTSGALIGLIGDRPNGDEPDVHPLARLAPGYLEPLLALPGAELMGPGDGYLPHLLDVVTRLEPEQLPAIEEGWGDPDVFLVLEHEGRAVARVEVSPQQPPTEPRLIPFPSDRGLTARLIERDLTLTRGEEAKPLSDDLEGLSLASQVEWRFDVVDALRTGESGPTEIGIALQFEALRAERASGADKTPLGAERQGLGRVAEGSVDWWGGDASDFWTVDVELGGTVLCLFFREDPEALLALQAFVPGGPQPAFETNARVTDRLHLAAGSVPPGQLMLRVRQVGGLPGPAGYSLFLSPRAEGPAGVLRTLFRLLGRQRPRLFPFLASKEFARQVERVLTAGAGFTADELAAALLDHLGDRLHPGRHLALHLLNGPFRPSLAHLESTRRKSATADQSGGGRSLKRRARDAGLLLALRCTRRDELRRYVRILAGREGLAPSVLDPRSPDHDPVVAGRLQGTATAILLQAVLDAANDTADPSIRLRALAVASRWEDAETKRRLRRELRQLLRTDPSEMVRRALERSFPGDSEERQRRLRQRASRRAR